MSTFHLFTSLAPELRQQIWHAALPDEIGPVLYFYKTGGWYPHHPGNDESCIEFKYGHEFLDAVQIEISLFFVNREARHIVLAWIEKHNIKRRVYARKDRRLQAPTFVRHFDPMYDVLYVAADKWNEFWCEPDDRCSRPDMMDQLISVHPANVTRIAMPEALFRGEGEVAATLAELIVNIISSSFFDFWFSDLQQLQDQFFGNISVLLIMVNTPLDLQPVNNGMKVQPRWELKNVEGGAFFWNHDHRRFDFNGSDHLIDEALRKLMEEINEWIGIELVKSSIRSFEVRPVFAIRA